MICDVCQSILTVEPLRDGLVPEKPHHRTCQGFKRSVGLGCYICNELWDSLKPDEQDLISSEAESGQHSVNSGTGDIADDSPENSIEVPVTTSWLGDGTIYGWPRCYHLSLAVDTRVVFDPEMRWPARFVLEPLNGTSVV